MNTELKNRIELARIALEDRECGVLAGSLTEGIEPPQKYADVSDYYELLKVTIGAWFGVSIEIYSVERQIEKKNK